MPQDNDSDDDQEELEEVYEPTQQEIIGYAEFLGMNLQEDADLLYIAEEGVSALLCILTAPSYS